MGGRLVSNSLSFTKLMRHCYDTYLSINDDIDMVFISVNLPEVQLQLRNFNYNHKFLDWDFVLFFISILSPISFLILLMKRLEEPPFFKCCGEVIHIHLTKWTVSLSTEFFIKLHLTLKL